MNLERAGMKMKLEGDRARERRMTLRIEALCAAIRIDLNTAMTKVRDLEVPKAAEQMDELVAAWGELQAISSEIARLEKELA